MARLTPGRDALVIRLVYDGPPHSGKTTSLRALGEGMVRQVFSPGESDGRTRFFDWLDYVGGSFEGLPIRCQIVSVPGQQELAARRSALLSEADAVVFVVNSSNGHLAEAVRHLGSLRGHLAERPEPRPGVVVQANHRDHPDAVPLSDLDAALGLGGLGLVASVATEKRGLREAFVLAVRLALDRARELLRLGILPADEGEINDPDTLLAWLKALEGWGAQEAAPPVEVTPNRPAPLPESAEPREPGLPDGDAPSGRVWPPIEGRMLLHAATVPGGVPRLSADGAWRFRSGPWYYHSAPGHELNALDAAKAELVQWAQRHASGMNRLSPRRCITLADTGWKTWRLWQVVYVEETWRQRLGTALRGEMPFADIERDLRKAVRRLLWAREAFAQEPCLPCRLDLIGEASGKPAYVGLLPPVGWNPAAGELEITDEELVRREIEPLFQAARQDLRDRLIEILPSLLAGT